MKNIPILGKVLAIVFAFALFVVGATVFATGKMRVIDDTYSDLSDHQGAASVALSRASRATWAMRAGIADLLIARDDAGNKVAEEAFASQHADFLSYADTAINVLPDHAATFTALKQKALQAVDQTCAETRRLGQATDAENVLKAQLVYAKDCAPAIAGVTAELRKAVDDLLKETRTVNDATTDVTNATIHLTWAMILGGLLLVVGGAVFGTRIWISKPLNTLASSMSAIAAGNYTVQIPGEDRKDEVGTMARVAHIFKVTGTEKVALEQQAARQHEEAERKRLREDETQKALAAEQAQVVAGLASGLERLSEGDLVFSLETPFAPEYDKLRTDFNAAIGKLRNTMTVIASSTSAIRSGTSEISTAASDLSRRTEQQAASLEETAAALDEITATVKKTAEGATQARTVVSTAKKDAEHSGMVVGEAVQAMSAIEASSRQISQIIGVIDEIAFQTNLLALNAGVEAARAGEAGRGFAVVASEVRALAQRSAEAAKEIKALISASAEQVSGGVNLVGETGKALERIALQVAEINTIVADITSSAQEQAAGLDQVNTAINQMDQVTQQNAAMVEESTAASNNLAQETGELARLIGQFNVGMSGHAGAARPSAGPAPRSAPALKVGRTAQAVRKPELQAEQSWEEF